MTTHTARVAIGCILFAGGCGWLGDAAHAQAAVRERILGAWQLESRIVRKASGETLIDPVLGQQPTGRLFYDASGHMALEMMRQGRSQAIGVPANSKHATNPRVVLGYDAYFGTFRLNEPDGTITHHVEGSLFPEDLGKDFQRGLKVDGDTLTLSFTSRSPEGFDVTRHTAFSAVELAPQNHQQFHSELSSNGLRRQMIGYRYPTAIAYRMSRVSAVSRYAGERRRAEGNLLIGRLARSTALGRDRPAKIRGSRSNQVRPVQRIV